MNTELTELTATVKADAGLTIELESMLIQVAPQMLPYLNAASVLFFEQIEELPRVSAILGSEPQKQTYLSSYLQWLQSWFTTEIDETFICNLYSLGQCYAETQLPIEYMIGAVSMINNELTRIVMELFITNISHCSKVIQAVNAVSTIVLIVVQQAYHERKPLEDAEQFLIDFSHNLNAL